MSLSTLLKLSMLKDYMDATVVDEVNMYTMLDSIVKREDLGVEKKKQCGDCAYKSGTTIVVPI